MVTPIRLHLWSDGTLQHRGQNSRNAVFASVSETPSRRRPIRSTQLEVADCSADGLLLLVSGIVISGATPGAMPKNPLGVTPTMV